MVHGYTSLQSDNKKDSTVTGDTSRQFHKYKTVCFSLCKGRDIPNIRIDRCSDFVDVCEGKVDLKHIVCRELKLSIRDLVRV